MTYTTYEWIGTGNPCLPDPTLDIYHPDNLIKGAVIEEPVPTTCYETAIGVMKYSCVSGYEPDISDPLNPQPDGFPDPTWEPLPP